MKKFNIKVTESAVQDLRNLREYLDDSFGNDRALKHIKEIIGVYTSLEDFPYKGKSAANITNLLEAYYYLPTNQNIVFYSIDDEKQSILIHRIFSTKEDFMQKFLGYTGKESSE